MTNTEARQVANQAANAALDRYLAEAKAGAAQHVPDCVIEAAEIAYRAAGGTGAIQVRGHGNMTHPVSSVSVVGDKRPIYSTRA